MLFGPVIASTLKMPASLPALATLDSTQETASADPEPALECLRAQAAVVRTLTDHIARFVHTDAAEALQGQLAEEVSRLAGLERAASRLPTSATRPL